ncbi:DNA-binding MarR family transcriptional regulator [Mucilaginibacter frigoritolerans]|jgi:DNA-binding MarR family transcriptional regulator|uniref:DNA-binding MarR family transcriptional regulator n=1 Tax=Mucilaginibacter frigoritolerans TaxID=652788 RepID=A0A562TU54_9SPHI|nr:MarR family transcriptional regulator [Mucilaginibacter frigoritolerans]TWI96778.1 DNA-binding MarR family transcriptional regulator [Mucilaginibacter frigoritolerans]
MEPKIKPKSKEELALEFGRSMTEMKSFIRQYIQVKIKEHNINITFEMLEVMACLWKKDGINQQEIADITLRDKSSMTYLIDNLVKRQMVKRVEDEVDRRNKLIFLTDEGNKLRATLMPWVAEVYQMATVDVDMRALEDGVMMVNKMLNNLKM